VCCKCWLGGGRVEVWWIFEKVGSEIFGVRIGARHLGLQEFLRMTMVSIMWLSAWKIGGQHLMSRSGLSCDVDPQCPRYLRRFLDSSGTSRGKGQDCKSPWKKQGQRLLLFLNRAILASLTPSLKT